MVQDIPFVHKVGLVVDPDYGERISEIANRMHVWTVNSAANMSAIKEWYADHENEGYSFLRGASSFDWEAAHTPEQVAAKIIETINDHHGPTWSEEFGGIPAWSWIEVYGCTPGEPLKRVLNDYGVSHFELQPFGFVGRTAADS